MKPHANMQEYLVLSLDSLQSGAAQYGSRRQLLTGVVL